MNVRTFATMMKSGRLLALLRFKILFTSFYRLCFFASMSDRVLLEALYRGPIKVESLPGNIANNPSLRNAAEAWLELGVHLGIIRKHDAKYSLRGFLTKRLAAPENDAIRALVREVASLHYHYIMHTPDKLEEGRIWNPGELHMKYGDLIARSSRTLEPFLYEIIDRVFPKSGSVRLLETGCGHAGYVIYAAEKNSSLSAVGLELDVAVAETAQRNIQKRGMADRIDIVVADVRNYRSAGLFDIVTLYNNIYYFPVEERTALLKHLRSILKPQGLMLLTTGCGGGGIEFELVNLIHAATEGWGRLPDKTELLQQFAEAGFERTSAISLLPGNKYYAFVGYNPG